MNASMEAEVSKFPAPLGLRSILYRLVTVIDTFNDMDPVW